MRRIFKNKKGFSLAEMMIVVAIICILFGVGAINVVKYKKKLKQLQYDSYAETIFSAAQNRMTELYAANGNGIFRNDSSDTSLTKVITNKDVSDLLFPVNSISEELISKGWAVEYNPQNGFVFAAYYSENPDVNWSDRENLAKKENGFRTNATVGYFGTADNTVYYTMQDYSCKLTIINKDILKAHVDVKAATDYTGTNATLYFTVSSADGKRSVKKSATVTLSEGSGSYDLVLDSLKKDGTTSLRFKDQYCTETGSLLPGEDIIVSVYAAFPDSGVENTAPVSEKTNSLFAKVDGTTAYVRYGRHLQNLDMASGIGSRINAVEQDMSIDFTDTSADMWANEDVYALSSGAVPYLPFTPIENESILTYNSVNYVSTSTGPGSTEGSGCTITGLIVTGSTMSDPYAGIDEHGNPVPLCGGVFGTFYGTGITGMNLAGAYVNSSGSAGAVAGKMMSQNGPVTLSNCSSYLLYPDYQPYYGADGAKTKQWIKSTTGNAGGLFGESTGKVKMQYCSSSSVVYSKTGNAGGFFGSAATVEEISHSYADCYVYGPLSTGGMGGTGSVTASSISSCYSAGFLFTPAGSDGKTKKAGGYIPGIVTTDTDSYSIFSYNFGTVTDTSDPVDNPGGRSLSGDFITLTTSAEDAAVKAEFTTAYNIGKTGLSSYEYPVLKKMGHTGTEASDYIHHYGDWEGITGISVTWDNSANPAINERMPVRQDPVAEDPTHITPLLQTWTLAGTMGAYTLDKTEAVDVAYWPVSNGSGFSWRDFRYNGVRYTFIGWKDSSDNAICNESGTGLVKNGEPQENFEVSKVYQAQYQKRCNVGFCLTGYGAEIISKIYIPNLEDFPCGSTFGEVRSFPNSVTGFAAKAGYTLPEGLTIDGWYTDPACSSASKVNSGNQIIADTILYARVKCDVTYTDPRTDGKSKTITVDYGWPFTGDGIFQSDFGEESLFLADEWYQYENYTAVEPVGTPIYKDTEVFARWKCFVTFKSESAYADTCPSVDSAYHYVDSPFSAFLDTTTQTSINSTIKDSVFTKSDTWYRNCVNEVCTNAIKLTDPISENTTVYVQWNGFVLHSDSWGKDAWKKFGPSEGLSYINGYTDTIKPASLDGYVNYRFDSWCLSDRTKATNPDTNPVALLANLTVRNESANLVYEVKGIRNLYAKWILPQDSTIIGDSTNFGKRVPSNGELSANLIDTGYYLLGDSHQSKSGSHSDMAALAVDENGNVITGTAHIYNSLANTNGGVKYSEVPMEDIWIVEEAVHSNSYYLRSKNTGAYLAGKKIGGTYQLITLSERSADSSLCLEWTQLSNGYLCADFGNNEKPLLGFDSNDNVALGVSYSSADTRKKGSTVAFLFKLGDSAKELEYYEH